jgi:hypothetical protein
MVTTAGGSADSASADSATVRRTSGASRDHDIHKGAIEDDRPSATTNAPGLDDDGLPNDDVAIAESALAARADGSQG